MQVEDKNLLGSIYDKYRLCIDTGMRVVTEEFYPPNIWMGVSRLARQLGVKVEGVGYFDFAERKRIGFIPLDNDWYDMGVEEFKVKLRNKSGFKKLSHRDYLGSIMSLGIKRELLSDLVVDGDACYFITNKVIAELIEQNITKAGRNPLEFTYLKDEKLPEHNFEELVVIASALRLDSVVAVLAKGSRSDAVERIRKKEVLVDYEVKENRSMQVKEASIISIRGIGKFIFVEQVGETKKERLKLKFKKFA